MTLPSKVDVTISEQEINVSEFMQLAQSQLSFP